LEKEIVALDPTSPDHLIFIHQVTEEVEVNKKLIEEMLPKIYK